MENPHTFLEDETVSFFMQAGGCLEIHQVSGSDQDLVHICPDNIKPFLEDLIDFYKTKRVYD